jgi:uncharacterized protein (UPF0332 family)
MDPRDFLTLAKSLQSGKAEAEWRTAISRSYYAGFHAARQLLLGWGFQIGRTDQAHVGITRRLAAASVVELATASRELSDLRSKRNAADYDLDRVCRTELATRCVKMADLILKLLAAEIPLPQQEQTIQAIREYERNVLRDVTWRSLN